MNSLSEDVRLSIRHFCESDLAVKHSQASHREACEPHIVRRNTSYASLVRVMQDDDLNIVKLPSGGFLRKSTVKTQCAFKQDVVMAAVDAAMAEFKTMPPLPIAEARKTLFDLLKKYVREHRTSNVVKVTHVNSVPRGISEDDIPQANEFISTTASTWIDVRDTLSTTQRAHLDTKRELELKRDSFLDMPGVRDYMKQECKEGKPVRIQGHDSEFTLRYTASRRRNPVRETHVQESISHVIETTDPNTVSASELATLILATAFEKVGEEVSDTFSLCARTGRKRAVDGCVK